jgi:hypothetical protein
MADTEEIFTLVAIWLALLGKAVSGLATLAFIWATVVILGGFATIIETTDFWLVTVILFLEGTCTITRTRDCEWQHKATLKLILNPSWKLFKPKNLTRLLFILQLQWVLVCCLFCLLRLTKQDYGVVSDGTTKNRKSVLNLFYGLSLAIGLLYVLQEVCWNTVDRVLFPTVTGQYGFIRSEMDKIYPFFYDIYSRYTNGSVFDGLRTEFVPYTLELLLSSDGDKQLMGTQVLSVLAGNDQFSEKTLTIMVTKPEVVERLFEMLNWRHPDEERIRRAVAGIVLDMVRIQSNRVRVMAITGSIESIGSLLLDHSKDQYPDAYGYSVLSLLGLQIIEGLVKQEAKIESNITDLLPKILGLIKLNPNATTTQIQTVRLALELVRMFFQLLTSTDLDDMDLEMGISNLADVLLYQEAPTPGLQTLDFDTSNNLEKDHITISGLQIQAINILKSFPEKVIHLNRERALLNLLSVFLMVGVNNNEETRGLVMAAGEALDLLSDNYESENCTLMMSPKLGHGHLNLMVTLISLLDDPLRGIIVARILGNLFEYAQKDCVEFSEISAVAAKVLVSVMEKQNEQKEAALRLAAKILKFIHRWDFVFVLEEWSGVTTLSLIWELVNVLRRYPHTSNEVPIRTSSARLLIVVLRSMTQNNFPNRTSNGRIPVLTSISNELILVLRNEFSKGEIGSDPFSFYYEIEHEIVHRKHQKYPN